MIKLILIFTLVMGGGGFGAYKWITKLQKDNQILQVNQSKLEGAVSKQQVTIEQHMADAASIQAANADLREQQTVLEKDRKNLTKKLGRHELDVLAASKPGLVVKIINRASKNELRCFELQTGSPHTEEELQANKKSQLNSECPTLANPNYTSENT